MLKPGREGSARAMLAVSAAVWLASSTWLSGTAVAPQLMRVWALSGAQAAWLTIGVQLGFITGTFLYAALNLADVFNARNVFLASALSGAAFNAAFAWLSPGLGEAVLFRFLTGVTLAGVYPVGMRIIASWYRAGLGWRLGVMVGALTLGAAVPYLLGFVGAERDWRVLVSVASLLAVVGGGLVKFGLSDGPFLGRRASFDAAMMFKVFGHRRFRLTALGYFGHMWELYAVWSLLSFFLDRRLGGEASVWVPLLVFGFIAAGAAGCVAGGRVSLGWGERRVALVSLLGSGLICAGSGLLYELPLMLLLPVVLLWGVLVVSDSPQFSALAARYCPPRYTGTALTIQNGIGFAITVVSIQLLPWVAEAVSWRWAFVLLCPGPLAGAWAMHRLGEDE